MNTIDIHLPELEAQLGEHGPAVLAAGQFIIQLRLTADQVEIILPDLVAELKQSTRFWAGAVLVAALPLLVERFRRSYAGRPGVTYADAEDLSHNVVVKVLTALIRGSRPHGNVGAWLARIQERVYLDYQRQRNRRRRGLERIELALHKFRRK